MYVLKGMQKRLSPGGLNSEWASYKNIFCPFIPMMNIDFPSLIAECPSLGIGQGGCCFKKVHITSRFDVVVIGVVKELGASGKSSTNISHSDIQRKSER